MKAEKRPLLNDGRIAAEDIRNAIVNLKQLVFEVTDMCNLACKYCAYGDMYFGYDKRQDSFLSIDKGKAIIDYLFSIWDTRAPIAMAPSTYISFYGGEPLLNMDFIKAIVDYIQSKDNIRQFTFSMTTNGLLLDRHIEFLVSNKFNILLSLDGNQKENGHRQTHAGSSSFEKVFTNVKMVQREYPSYFQEHVHFNTVLHNLNSVESAYKFFLNEFGKETTISELNTSNIRRDKTEEFFNLYKNKVESISSSSIRNVLENNLLMGNPQTHDLLIFLHKYSGNVYKDYSDLFVNPSSQHYIPTGTCIPFGKKMFVTVNGKILPCEKISQDFVLGMIDGANNVHLDFEGIANNFNNLLGKVQGQCSSCYRKKSCIQCIYNMTDVEKTCPKCQGYMTQAAFNQYAGSCLTYLYEHPELYNRLLRDVIVE